MAPGSVAVGRPRIRGNERVPAHWHPLQAEVPVGEQARRSRPVGYPSPQSKSNPARWMAALGIVVCEKDGHENQCADHSDDPNGNGLGGHLLFGPGPSLPSGANGMHDRISLFVPRLGPIGRFELIPSGQQFAIVTPRRDTMRRRRAGSAKRGGRRSGTSGELPDGISRRRRRFARAEGLRGEGSIVGSAARKALPRTSTTGGPGVPRSRQEAARWRYGS